MNHVGTVVTMPIVTLVPLRLSQSSHSHGTIVTTAVVLL